MCASAVKLTIDITHITYYLYINFHQHKLALALYRMKRVARITIAQTRW